MHDPRTATYYDRLTRWTSTARLFGYGGGRSELTVHRALADPRAGGRTTRTRLHDLVLESLPTMGSPHVLDAGCGFGGTMIDFAQRLGGTYVGVTLSGAQQQIAVGAVAAAGLASRIRVVQGTYDAPPAEPYDLILAIESLAHSADPVLSLAALTGTLARDGVLAIVDDMPTDAAGGSRDLAVFKRGWRCPVLWSLHEYREQVAKLGLELLLDRDLTPELRPRTLLQLAWLERVNAAARLFPSAAWRDMLESYRGGLALERMYRRRQMQYRLLLARRSM